MSLVNCKECGKVFIKRLDNVCPDCVKKRNSELEKIRDWMSSNKNPNLENIENEINVSEKNFKEYLNSGKLRGLGNINSKCEMCGKETSISGKNILCADCRSEIKGAQTSGSSADGNIKIKKKGGSRFYSKHDGTEFEYFED